MEHMFTDKHFVDRLRSPNFVCMCITTYMYIYIYIYIFVWARADLSPRAAARSPNLCMERVFTDKHFVIIMFIIITTIVTTIITISITTTATIATTISPNFACPFVRVRARVSIRRDLNPGGFKDN